MTKWRGVSKTNDDTENNVGRDSENIASCALHSCNNDISILILMHAKIII